MNPSVLCDRSSEPGVGMWRGVGSIASAGSFVLENAIWTETRKKFEDFKYYVGYKSNLIYM
jgi:hypothetical protein